MKEGTGKKQTGKRQDAIVPAQAGENYPMEDRALKEAARFMGGRICGDFGPMRRWSVTSMGLMCVRMWCVRP